jgi:hypothetical protein
MILQFFDIFSLTQKMGTTPSELYKTVWKKLYSADAADLSLKDAADALYRFLALIHQA